jgi:glycosyltransferase involved in cell wall biosynthesis/GT2 family glycosyltransferase
MERKAFDRGNERLTPLLRVDVVVPVGTAGGSELSLLELLDATADRLAPAVISLADGPLVSTWERRGWPVEVVPTGADLGPVIRAIVHLEGRWRRDPPDVALASGPRSGVVAACAGLLAGVRVAWFKRDFSHDRLLTPVLARMVDAVLPISEEVRDTLPDRDAVVIPPPRPPEPLPHREAAERLRGLGVIRGKSLTVAAIGRLVSYKGFDDLIEALALPRAAGWHLVVMGDDDPAQPHERRRLQRLTASAGIGDRVSFPGPVPEVGRLLGGFDAVAVPTKTDRHGFGREGFSRVALEAMAAGVPVVAATGGGLARRLDGAGVPVPPASPARLADALGRLTDPATRSAMGGRGRAVARSHPDLDEVARRFLSALTAVAARPGAGARRRSGPPVSVIATVRDEGPHIDRLLDALLPQLDGDDEVVIADGGSTDDTVDRIRSRSERNTALRLVEASGANIPAGRNDAVRAARHDVLASTDAGCLPERSWVDSLRAAFVERPAADLVTGLYRPVAGTPFQAAAAAACYPDVREASRPGLLTRLSGLAFGRTFEASMPTGRSMAFTRRAWEDWGGFPEALETAEDVAFGRKITAAGGRAALALDALVDWNQRSTLRATAAMYYRYGVGDARSGDLKVIGRDLLRAVAYLCTPVAWGRGGPRVRTLIALGWASYLAVPILRARRYPRAPLVAAGVPVAAAVKDVAKAAGCVAGLLAGWWRRDGHGAAPSRP